MDIYENYILKLEKTLVQIRKYQAQLLKEEEIDLTPDQWSIIEALKDLGEINQKQLAEHLEKDPASIKRTLDILEKEDVLARTTSAKDKRSHILSLTDKGSRIIHQLFPVMIDFEARGVRGVSGEEMEEFERVLGLIRDNFS